MGLQVAKRAAPLVFKGSSDRGQFYAERWRHALYRARVIPSALNMGDCYCARMRPARTHAVGYENIPRRAASPHRDSRAARPVLIGITEWRVLRRRGARPSPLLEFQWSGAHLSVEAPQGYALSLGFLGISVNDGFD